MHAAGRPSLTEPALPLRRSESTDPHIPRILAILFVMRTPSFLRGANPPPTTLPELWRRLGDDALCWEVLRELRWGPGEAVRNPRTGSPAVRFKPGRQLWVDATGAEFSLLAGTAMERTKVPLRVWLVAAWALATLSQGLSTAALARQCDLRLETAFQLLHRLRAGMVDPERTPLRGRVVLGVAPLAPGAPGHVLAAVEVVTAAGPSRRTGRVRLRVTSRITDATVAGFLGDHVAHGAVVVCSDASLARGCVRSGCARATTPTPSDAAIMARLLDGLHRWLATTHGGAVSRKHAQAYLNEYAWRASSHYDPMIAFQAALGLAVRVPAPRYADVYHAGERGRWQHVNPARGRRA